MADSAKLPDDLLTVNEVAEYLRVTPPTVYRWCRNGTLRAYCVGGIWRIARADLAEFMQPHVPADYTSLAERERHTSDVLRRHGLIK